MTPLALALTSNGYMAAPSGYPLSLSLAGSWMAEGVIPPGAVTVTVVARCQPGVTAAGDGEEPVANASGRTADLHLALFSAPSTSSGADGLIQESEDLEGLTATEETVVITVPSGTTTRPLPLVFKVWVDNLTGTDYVSVSSVKVA